MAADETQSGNAAYDDDSAEAFEGTLMDGLEDEPPYPIAANRQESWEWPNAGPMLDLTCPKCKSKGTYEIPVGCMNCGLQVVGIFSRGHEAYYSQRCPDCGCTTLSSSYARKATA